MKKSILFALFLISTMASFAQNAIRIKPGTNVKGRDNVQLSVKADSFVCNGDFKDSTGHLIIRHGILFSGNGATRCLNLTVNSPDTAVFNSLVSVYDTCYLQAGGLNANNNLWIRSDANNVANLVVTGVLYNNVRGLIARATATTGPCPLSTTLSVNVSGSAMKYQWQSSPDSITWSNLAGATSATYPATVTATGYYRCFLTTNNSPFSEATPGVLLTPTGGPSISAGSNTAICSGSSASLTATGGSTYTWAPPATLSSSIGSTVSASPLSITTYTVIGTDSYGCSNRATVTVSVNPLPTVSVPSSLTVCAGNSAGPFNFYPTPISSSTFSYTGSAQYYTVPSGITSVNIDIAGATGGGSVYNNGGAGGRVQCVYAVTPGQVLNVFVGYAGATFGIDTGAYGSNGTGYVGGNGGTNYGGGGGGGGCTEIQYGGARVLVAGGGGGGSQSYPTDHGGPGGNAYGGYGLEAGIYQPYYCGAGGSQTAGGAAGSYSFFGSGSDGSYGSGGNGGSSMDGWEGGGGAGYYGGGGGLNDGSGGGGSSFPVTNGGAVSNLVLTQGYNTGNGYVTISAIGNTTYAWANSNASIGIATTGTGNIGTFTAENGTSAPVSSVITVTPSANGCTGSAQSFSVTVKPKPEELTGPAINTSLYVKTLESGVSDGIYSDNRGNVYWTDRNNFVIRKTSPSGGTSIVAGQYGSYGYSGDGGPATAAQFQSPIDIKGDASGNLYISDNAGFIRKIDPSGIITTIAGNGSTGYSGDGGPATSASFSNLLGIAVDNYGNVYAADNGNTFSYPYSGAIRKIDTSGNINAVANSANPKYITVDGTGNIYFTSNYWPTVQKIDTSGIATTIAGGSTIGYSGDGGPATSAILNSPEGINFDAAGNLYIADNGDGVVRKISTSGIITSVTSGSGGSSSDGPATATFLGQPTGLFCNNGIVYVTTDATGEIREIYLQSTSASLCLGAITTFGDSVSGGAWSSSNTSVATVGSTGTVTAVGAGIATISYGNGCTPATVTVTVNPIPTVTVPSNQTACAGTVVGPLNFSGSVSGATYTWANSNTLIGLASAGTGNIAAFTATDGTNASLSSVISVTPSANGCTGTAQSFSVTVNPLPSAGTISGLSVVNLGLTITLTDSVTGGIWSATNSHATVSAGVVTGVTGGYDTIKYTYTNSCGSAVATKTVYSNAITAISGSTTLCAGSTTILTDSLSGGIWSSSNPAVATIGSSNGVVNGIANGTTTITYSAFGSLVTSVLTVNSVPPPITGPSVVCVGQNISLYNSAGGGVWSSTAPTIAAINATTGVVTGVAGSLTALLSYTLGTGCAATYTVTVNPLLPIYGSATICLGQSVTLTDGVPGGTWSSSGSDVTIGSSSGLVSAIANGTATISYTTTNSCVATSVLTLYPTSPITGPASVCQGQTITLGDSVAGGVWSSTIPTMASIGSSGIVTGIASGIVNLSYTLGSGCAVGFTVTVNALASISGPSEVCVGQNITLTDAIGGTWSSPGGLVAVGSGSGIVYGISGGTAIVSFTTPLGCIATTSLSVNASSPISGPASVCQGQTITLSDSVAGGVWSSTIPTMASIGSSGIVTGIASGIVNFSYTLGSGCAEGYTVTVNALASISGATSVCQGSSTILAITTGGGTWSSSNSVVSVTGSTGSVLGVSAGTAIISYTTPGGCVAIIPFTVYANSPIVGLSSLCQGLNITLADSLTGGLWSSSNPSIATVGSSTGIVTGIAGGLTVNVSYTLGSGCYALTTLTVNALSSTSGVSTLCQSQYATFTNSNPGGIWSSNNTAVATVGTASGIVGGMAGGSAVITYTLPSGCAATSPLTVYAVSPITGPSQVCVGQTTTLSESGGGIWTSSNPSIATVGSSTGIVTGIAGGLTVNVTYTLGSGCYALTTLTVNALSPVSGVSSLCQGQNATFTNTTPGGIWTSNNTAVATVGSSTGIVSAMSGGSAIITYTLPSGCAATSVLSVNWVSPITGPGSVCYGQTITLGESGSGIWTSSNPSIATVGSSTGIVTGMAGGLTVNVSYTLSSGCYALTTLTVNALSPVSGVSSLCQGQNATFTNTTPGGIWTSNNTAVATVGSSTGIVSAMSGGSAIISYTLPSGCAATSVLSVNGVSPITGPSQVCVGQTITLSESGGGVWSSSSPTIATIGSASGFVTGMAGPFIAYITYTYASGCYATNVVSVNPLGPISGPGAVCNGLTINLSDGISGGTWRSSATSVVTVGSTTGVVTGVSGGTAIISYILPTGCLATTVISGGAISPITGSSNVCIGQSSTLSDVSPGGVWSSGSPTIATVGSTGIVTGVAGNLSATISYTLGSSCRATLVVTVYPLSPISISSTIPICMGTNTTATDATSGGRWTSGNSSIVTVGSGSGVITGVTSGTTFISYILPSGCTSTASVLVNPLTPIAGPTTICLNATTTLTDGAPGGTWSSSSPTIAGIIAGTGVVTGNAANLTSTISYTLSTGCRATMVLSVAPLPAAPGSISGPSTVSVSGSHITLSCTPAGGTWSSSNTAKATVNSSTGVVTGVSTGSVIITYIVSNSAGCTNYATKNVTVGPAPNENQAENVEIPNQGINVILVPNPNNGDFNVKGTMNITDGQANLQVIDMLGQKVFETTATVRDGKINEQIMLSSSLPNGMYLLNLLSDYKMKVFHFVLER